MKHDLLIICFVAIACVLFGWLISYAFNIDVTEQITKVSYPETKQGEFCEHKVPSTYKDYQMCEDIKIVEETSGITVYSIFSLGLFGMTGFAVIMLILFIISMIFTQVGK